MKKSSSIKQIFFFLLTSILFLALATVAQAVPLSGVGSIAANVTSNFDRLAKLITAASYIAGMATGVAAIVKFKAYKDNPTQIPIGMPIALLFVAAALLFIPSVFKTSGGTLFGGSGTVAGISGITSFGASKAGG